MVKGLTVGVFDILHIGHLRMLARAKQLCDHLTVAVHDDKLNIKNVKFFYSLQERQEFLKYINVVDSVITYERADLIVEATEFDIFFYGPDQNHLYFQKAFEYCQKNGKSIMELPRTEGISSTRLREVLNSKGI